MDAPHPDQSEPLVDLGAVSIKTRGGPEFIPELSCERPADGLVED